ncbi:unnamed protein product [Pocillopora meandrina]|uniref:Uncharacterized protein n=1 Tax=Pocillopora meandrina TaxID=46732 RepID=A0AAU9XTR7_9CNID|nr:unnamed protein product [Pocillopora meandrina]
MTVVVFKNILKIPPSYKGRVKIEGRATLVIKNINPGDNTEFECELIGDFFVCGTKHSATYCGRGTTYKHLFKRKISH